MKRFCLHILFISLLISSMALRAQTAYADSLEKFIQTAKPDTNKVNAMYIYAYEFRNNDPQKCISTAEKALELANKLGYQKGIGMSELAIGTAQTSMSDNQEAIIHLNKALEVFTKQNDKRNLSRAYNNIANVYKAFNNMEEAKKKYNQTLEICEEIGNEDGKAMAYNNLGGVYLTEANYPVALKYLDQALLIRKKLGNKLQIADSYYFISMVNSNQGLYPEALKNLFNILPIREEFNDKVGLADTYGAIGIIYTKMGNYKEANEYHLKSLKIAQSADDKLGIGNAAFNLGTTCLYQKELDKALDYFETALADKEEISDRGGVAGCYANMAEAYRLKKDYPKAISYAEKAMSYYRVLNAKDGEAITALTLGTIYTNIKKYAEAETYFDKGLQVAYDIKSKEIIRDAYHYYIELDSASGNFSKAFEHNKKYMIYRDSVTNEENTRRIVQTQMQYEFDKKESLAKVEQEKKDRLAADEQTKQKWVRNAFVGGFLLMILLAGIAFRNFKRKQKDNETITKQKELVEEKNREITQSIEYALRIQTAILPPSRVIKQHLPQSCILYLPKDIVAGDFYWMEVVGQKILFAACDCTGHGVPGAMVSVICHNALNRSVREFGLISPAAILDKTAEIVIENFALSENQIKDGMDISLCVLDKKTKSLEWAGANNPLWLLRKGELLETKADKQPIGVYDNNKPFTNHTFQLDAKDRIYLFTDGFADQFGGVKEKKLTRKSFKELILSMSEEPLAGQEIVLNQFITNYRNKLEQIDDILVIGVEIPA